MNTMGPVDWQEMMFIFLLALIIFGPTKLPELGRNLGKAMTEFRKAPAHERSFLPSIEMAGFVLSGVVGCSLLAVDSFGGPLGLLGFVLVVIGVVGLLTGFA